MHEDAWEQWNVYSISNIAALRQVLRSLRALESLAAEGDSTSATILMDIRNAMRYEKTELVRVISPRQYEAISLYLIDNLTMRDVVQRMKIDRRRVHYHIETGLRHMLRYMQYNETAKWYGKPWQYEYIKNHSHLPTAELAQHLRKTNSAVSIMLSKLRQEGFVIPRGTGGRTPSKGSSEPAQLESRRIPVPIARPNTKSA